MQIVMPLYPFLINSQRIVPFEDPLFFIHIPLIKGVSTLTVNFDLTDFLSVLILIPVASLLQTQSLPS